MHGGARLLATSPAQDATLLRLEGQMPSEVSFSGWSAEPVDHPSAVYGLHHPDGYVMKYSAGSTSHQQDVALTGLGILVNAIIVRWHSGATEGGSSGSGLFDDARDLEQGDSSETLSEGVGDGIGHWRLELTTSLDIEARAYIRTPDEFLTSIHEAVAGSEAGEDADTGEGQDGEGESARFYVPILNPGSNVGQESWLRLINPGDHAAEIVIEGTDDHGDPPPEGEVRLVLAAGAARMLSAQQIEEGGTDFDGQFGDGVGKWRLSVSADRPIQVMSLMQSATGHLTNLSR